MAVGDYLPAGWVEARFPVMACGGQVLVHGDPALLAVGEHRLRTLEARWSRFVPSSDVSRVNDADGAWTRVSPETLDLFALSIEAWWATAGDFDPTVLPALRALTGEESGEAGPAPGLGRAELDTARGRVRLGVGVRFDPGGIGKGLAADLVCEELVASGATAVLVNVGGDLRAVGDAPWPGDWGVDVEVPGGSLLVGIPEGGVATSSPDARRGAGPVGEWHHLLDPGSGLPLVDSPLTATAVAPEAWQAEVWTKVLLRRGPEAGLRAADAAGLPALVAGTQPVDPVQVNRAMSRLLHGASDGRARDERVRA